MTALSWQKCQLVGQPVVVDRNPSGRPHPPVVAWAPHPAVPRAGRHSIVQTIYVDEPGSPAVLASKTARPAQVAAPAAAVAVVRSRWASNQRVRA